MLNVQSAVKCYTDFEAYKIAMASISADTILRSGSFNWNTAMLCRDSSVAQSIQARGVGQIGSVIRAVVSTHANVRSLHT
jgi:hypothetical protein